MSWKRLLIIGGVVLLAGSWGLAGDLSDQEWNEVVQMGENQHDARQTASTLVKMSHFVDLWHDATLKGEKKLVTQREQELTEIIKSDLRRSYQYLDECEKELTGWKQEHSRQALEARNDRPAPTAAGNKHPDLRQAFSIVKAKQRLAGALSRSHVFSNKLRLFGDYQELLRHELDLGSVRLAEAVDEIPLSPSGE